MYIWLQSRLAGYLFHYWIIAKNTSDFITHLRNIITLFMSYILQAVRAEQTAVHIPTDHLY